MKGVKMERQISKRNYFLKTLTILFLSIILLLPTLMLEGSVAKAAPVAEDRSIAATLGVIFHAPLFGFVNQVEDEKGGQAIPKNSKILLYFIAIFAGFGVYILLSGLFGGGMGLGRFGHITIGRNELLAMLPLALVGALCGILYFYFAKGVKVVTAPLEKHKVFLGIIGGLVLGGVGMLLPFTMFAGEHQMGEMMEIWQTLPIWLLFLTGIDHDGR